MTTENVEASVAKEFVTETIVYKALTRVVNDLLNDLTDGERFEIVNTAQVPREYIVANFRGRVAENLIGRVWVGILNEQHAIVECFKTPTINFKELRAQVTRVTKSLAPELF